MSFYTALTGELITNLHNSYFPLLNARSAKNKATNAVKDLLKSVGLYKIDFSDKEIIEHLKQFDPYMGGLNDFYEQLETQADKKLLVQLMAFRVLKWKIQLPLNNTSYFDLQKKSQALLNTSDSVATKAGGKLYKADLLPSFPVTLYQGASGLLDIFLLEQYKYDKQGTTIGAKKDDFVIDAGGCFGETALYFSNLVGEKGKVFRLNLFQAIWNCFERTCR
jgi:hypothetical protein